jgi:hypothetical protein
MTDAADVLGAGVAEECAESVDDLGASRTMRDESTKIVMTPATVVAAPRRTVSVGAPSRERLLPEPVGVGLGVLDQVEPLDQAADRSSAARSSTIFGKSAMTCAPARTRCTTNSVIRPAINRNATRKTSRVASHRRPNAACRCSQLTGCRAGEEHRDQDPGAHLARRPDQE